MDLARPSLLHEPDGACVGCRLLPHLVDVGGHFVEYVYLQFADDLVFYAMVFLSKSFSISAIVSIVMISTRSLGSNCSDANLSRA
jgi:hypothetical protein